VFSARDDGLKKPDIGTTGSGRSQYHDDVTEIYIQLEGIVGIIARYAIMETLYRQARAMSLEADYREALILLCCGILKWFVNAFTGDGPFAGPGGFAVSGKHWTTIQEMDRACQKFRITVDVPDDDAESEVDAEDVEDEGIET
jgi:hypothetical protein